MGPQISHIGDKLQYLIDNISLSFKSKFPDDID